MGTGRVCAWQAAVGCPVAGDVSGVHAGGPRSLVFVIPAPVIGKAPPVVPCGRTANQPAPAPPRPSHPQIFDWLRGLDDSHDLYALCNTMT